VYTPESALRRPGRLVRDMFRDLGNSRELAWRMFVRDVKAAHRQSFLGYIWIFLPPIASTLMFGFLQSQNILNVGQTEIPYPAFVLTGTLLWEAFASSIGAPLTAVSGASAMLTKLNFPREALLLTALYHIFFNLSLKLLLLVPVYLYFEVPLHATVIVGPAAMLTLVLFGFALGLWLVPLGLLYQDVGRMLSMTLGAWFVVTPVIYPAPTQWPATLVNQLNPVSPLLITARQLFIGSPLTHVGSAAVITCISLMAVLLGWVLYRLAMPHLVARMSA
jgi:lipopolysaccharide transport system permease protein